MQTLCGFLMALADSVPGVSGGTIAFIMGYYDDFIGSLHSLIRGNRDEKKHTLQFLIRLGIGWIVGFIAAVLVLTSLFQTYIYQVSSLFIGFILFSVPLVIHEEKQTLKQKPKACFFLLLGIALVVLLTMFSPTAGTEGAALSVNIGTLLYIMFAGMTAISAMVLPGISGSTLLLVFGLYMPVMNAIKGLLHFDFSGFAIVCFFGIGIVIGILLALHLVRRALERFRAQTIFFILGMMLGSVYSVLLGPTTLDVPQPAMSANTFSILFFLAGGLVIGGLQIVKHLFAHKHH